MTRYFTALDVFFGTASILSLTSISLERFYAVKYPARHHNMSHRPVYTSITLAWMLGLVFAAFPFFGVDLKTSTVVLFCSAFILPLIIIVASYVVIFVTAHNLKAAFNKNKTLSQDIQIAKTISVIIGLFIVCWAPFFLINMLYFFCSSCYDKFNWSLAVSLTKALHYSNSMMNFFVYAVRSPDFRETFKALIFHCDTNEVRERLRTLSMTSVRKRTLSFLSRKNNNNDDQYTNGNPEGREHSRLIFKNAQYNRNSEEVVTTTLNGSESPTIGFTVYDTE